MTRDLDESFDLTHGPQRRDPDEPEAWQKFLQERCPEQREEPRQ